MGSMNLLKYVTVLGLVLMASCSNPNPVTKDYQIAACADISDVILSGTGATDFSIKSLTSTPVKVTDNQVSVAHNYHDGKKVDYTTKITWTQDGEAMEMTIDLACLETSLDKPSSCISLKAGTITAQASTTTTEGTLSVNLTAFLNLDVSYQTPSAGPLTRLLGKLAYSTKSGFVVLQDVSCDASCKTTKEGRICIDDCTSEPAERECSYRCKNGATGTVQTTCAANDCSGESNQLTTAITAKIECSVTRNDFSVAAPLTVTLF